MATQVEGPQKSIKEAATEYMAELEAARAVYPWPEVSALLEAVPDGGLESMPEDDQCHLCRELAKLLAGTRDAPYALNLAGDVAKVFAGRGSRSTIERLRWCMGVVGLQRMTLEELAEEAKSWEEEE